MYRSLLRVAVALTSLAACTTEGETPADARPASAPEATAAAVAPDGQQDKIAQAMSAAPAAIAQHATIMDRPERAGGGMKQLRRGSSEWVCMPSSSQALRAGSEDPMCTDAASRAWITALTTRTPPRLGAVGITYMLRGDAGASNVDPFATGPTADNQWVVTGPHLMIFTPDVADLAKLPTDPKQGGPYVMWQGTPYAHLMVPVSAARP